jgi:DNA-binding NarL/FixJ family response regulator
MGQYLRVLLAAEYHLVHAALAMLIELADDLALIAETADGENVVAKATAYQPDILLLDPHLLKNAGSEIVLELQAVVPNTQIWVVAEDWQIYHYWLILVPETLPQRRRKISGHKLLQAISTHVDTQALVPPRLDP